ncbi:MAG TPA: tyrosine-type recombinase/integrase [Streptosporangiaceae bacterium]|nr:tyrosine-type recombinase/integrase [Streptosporangiaceae bacterium]
MQDLEAWAGRPADEPAWHEYRRALLATGRSDDTIYNYRHTLQLVSLSLPAGADLWTMRREDVTAFLAAGAAGDWARSSLATYSRRLRTFCLWAHRAGYADADPMTAVSPVREDVREIPVPDPAHIRALVATVATGKRFQDRRDWMIMCLLAEAGTPRATELADLPAAAPDLRHGQLRFTGKGGLERTIALGAASCRAVTLYQRSRAVHKDAGLPWLLLGKQGKMTRHGIRQMLEDRAAQAGVPRVPPHHWRHLTAHLFMEGGGSVPDAMKLFGWRTPLMASRYGGSAASARAVRHARELSIGDAILSGKARAG